eukprot:766400-Hanusia_phi.AAC.5
MEELRAEGLAQEAYTSEASADRRMGCAQFTNLGDPDSNEVDISEPSMRLSENSHELGEVMVMMMMMMRRRRRDSITLDQ